MTHIVFMRNVGNTSQDMLFDENWDILKVEMCRQMDIQNAFDAHDGWRHLREGAIILHEGMFFCYVNTENPQREFNGVGMAVTFKGELLEFTDEDELREPEVPSIAYWAKMKSMQGEPETQPGGVMSIRTCPLCIYAGDPNMFVIPEDVSKGKRPKVAMQHLMDRHGYAQTVAENDPWLTRIYDAATPVPEGPEFECKTCPNCGCPGME